MGQTITTAAFEVQPGSAAQLEQMLTDFRQSRERPGASPYDALKQAVPTLHFMSMMLFRQQHYDPLLVIEVNFDGPARPFWTLLERAVGPDLTALLRLCNAPRTAAAREQFKTLMTSGSGLAGLLDSVAIQPTASHLGNRGLTRSQIEAESLLFTDVQASLQDRAYRTRTAAESHATLRARLLPHHPWLGTPAPPRIVRAESRADIAALATFAAAAVAVLAVPGAVFALVLPAWFTALLGLAIAWHFAPRIPGVGDLRAMVQGGKPGTPSLWAVAIVLGVLALAAFLLWLAAAVLWVLAGLAMLVVGAAPPGLGAWSAGALWKIAAGLAAIPAVLCALLIYLRGLETRDSTQLAPVLNPAVQRQIAEREDQTGDVYQNHMGSIVLVKPGLLRSLVLRAGHHALYLILRVEARDGYLSDMRTVHFAHWALLNNGSRLIFLSNFDGTWDSYLDDFIEKANTGTTLAWTNCVGSPSARFLTLDGVKKGRQFKAWARHSMAPNLFWFSAYPKLTVNQIERNHANADGLRRPALETGEAVQWISKL